MQADEEKEKTKGIDEESGLDAGMPDDVDDERTLIDILDDHKIIYRKISHPKGLAIKVNVELDGKQYGVTILFDDDYDFVKSYQLPSQQPVDPSYFYKVERLLRFINKKQRLFRWRLMDDGYYVIEPSYDPTWGHMPVEIPLKIVVMVKKFAAVEPHIEELAHGKRDWNEVAKDLQNRNLV